MLSAPELAANNATFLTQESRARLQALRGIAEVRADAPAYSTAERTGVCVKGQLLTRLFAPDVPGLCQRGH